MHWFCLIFKKKNVFCLSGKKIWGFSRFTSDCASGYGRFLAGTNSDRKDDIHESCSQMMFQLHNVYDAEKVVKLTFIHVDFKRDIFVG